MKSLICALLVCCGSVQASVMFRGETRACAGGVADSTHTIQITAISSEAEAIEFSLQGEAGGFVVKGGLQPSVQATPNKSGRVALEIRSGAASSTPVLVARREGIEVARQQLDFGYAVQYRRFSQNDEPDYGLVSDDKTVKIFVKFRRNIAIGDVNGNWEPVAGHRLKIYIAEVDARATTGRVLTKPEEVAPYGRVFDLQNPSAQVSSMIVMTRADGSAICGAEITRNDGYSQVIVGADDLTQTDNANYRAPGVPEAQIVTSFLEKADSPMWFNSPDDLSLGLAWSPIRQKQQTLSRRSLRDSTWNAVEHFALPEFGENDSPSHWNWRQAFNWDFAPDGNRFLFWLSRPGQDADNNHDLGTGDFQSRSTKIARPYLFGESEAWAPDSRRIAFVDGSQDVIVNLRNRVNWKSDAKLRDLGSERGSVSQLYRLFRARV